MRRLLNPTSVVYILIHGLVFTLGVLLCITKNAVLVAIGTSLVAAGIVGWVVYAYVLVSEKISNSLDVINRFGLVNVFEGRQVRIKPEYDRILAQAEKTIDVMGFGLRALREDYNAQFARWRQKANVRILLIDPEFPSVDTSHAEQRDREEGDIEGTITQQVKQFVRETQEIRNSLGEHLFQIRLYRCLPSINIFRVDDELFWGPYLVKQPSRNTPTFLVKKGGILFDSFTQHFEQIWNDNNLSRSIPEDWL
jgi:hypothetical protein